jgi:hypothetical protein
MDRPDTLRRFLLVPLAVAAVLSLAYLVIAPLSADHAAQTFRTELFERAGPVLWNNYWFGGHHLPTYSVIAPALGSWIGFRLMGVAAVLGTVALYSAIVYRHWGERALAGAVWFSAAATVSLFSGRLTFALGVLLAVAAVFAAQRGRRALSLVLALSVALASPVAALFLACCGAAHWIHSLLPTGDQAPADAGDQTPAGVSGQAPAGARDPGPGANQGHDRRGLEIAVASFFTAGFIALLFPGGGDEPYVWTSFVPAVGLTLAAAALLPRSERLVRTGMLVYALALAGAFVIATPMGGNANRLGVLLVGSLFLCASWPLRFERLDLRTGATALLLPLLLLWQFYPMLRDLELVHEDPAVAASFYAPVETALGPRLEREPARVEVLPIDSHWESARLAPAIPLARGWERQTDRRLNRLFYRESLSPQRYLRWLRSLAVGYVAVPQGTPLDYAAEREAELIATEPPFLKEMEPVPGWRLYRVLGATPMVERPANLSEFSADAFAVSAPVAGSFRVRVRWTPYWRVSAGAGCVSRSFGGWTLVEASRPGTVEVEARFSPGARFSDGPHCRP